MTSTTTRATGFCGIIPPRGKTEIVAHAPLPKQCMPTSVLDPERMIFYAGHRRRRLQEQARAVFGV